MLTEIRIYYEGDRLLKPGFKTFFAKLRERAVDRRCAFRLISAGDRANACRDFNLALKTHPNAWNILLLDSEGPPASAREVLLQQYGWKVSQLDSVFWMVEMMESWFLADKDALEEFYGKGFNKMALKPNPQVEEISKSDLKACLSNATRNTQAGNYFDHKTSHGHQLLALIDAERVHAAAPNCKRLFDNVLERLG